MNQIFNKVALYLEISYGIARVCKNWIPVLLNHAAVKAHLTEGMLRTICMRDGTRFLAPQGRSALSDLGVIWEVWYRQVYLLPEKHLDVKPGDIVVDIGANKGYFSLYADKKGAKVLAFEPMPKNFAVLEKNIKINSADVFPNRVAISDVEKTISLHISQSDGGHSIVEETCSDDLVEVQAIALHDFMVQQKIGKIDFLKMDCEGAEYQILKSLSKDDLSKIRKISMEYHSVPGHAPEELLAILKTAGFEILEFAEGYLKASRI